MLKFFAVLLFLLLTVILGNVWFSLVEGMLARIGRFFSRRQKPRVWHTLKCDEKDDSDV